MKPHFLQWVSCGWITVLIGTQVLCGASSPGVFLEEPSDQEVNPADTVEMHCRLNPGAEKSQILWLKDGQLVNTVNNPSYAVTGDAQNNDFSIRINGVTVERDDGKWECQGFVAGGTVASRKAQLVVRQAPHDRPVMTRLGMDALLRNGEELPLRTDQNTTVVCEVRDANPPARIKWTVGPKDVSDFAHTINQTGPNSKLYNTISTLTYPYQPRDNQAQLKCDTIHAALAGSLSTSAHLNVQYAPIIQFQQEPPGDISEGQDVVLSCVADANPPATVKWIVNNNEVPMLNATTIKIEGASHGSNGNYTCVASNEPVFPNPTRVSYSVAVRYPPSFVIQPQGSSVDVDQDYTLFCDAEGYPPPRIQWLQNGTDGQMVVRGEERNLTLKIDYSSQGKYWCKASNTINNKDNIILSDVAELLVKGPPKFENSASNPRLEVIGDKGGEATLTALYCSNPPPSSTYWMREQNAGERLKSQRIEAGSGSKKYDIKLKDRSSGCYESRLTVSNLEVADGGKYKYRVENEKGVNMFTTMLTVRETVNTALIIGLVVGLGGALILGLIAALCCFRMKKFCFASSKKTGSFDIEKREVKQDSNGTTTIETTRTVQKEDNLKQNPLQTESMYKSEMKRPNGVGNHVIMNGVNGVQNGNDLSKKNGRVDGMPAEVLHYAQLDVDGPNEHGHNGPMGTPRMEVRNGHDYSDIRPTVL